MGKSAKMPKAQPAPPPPDPNADDAAKQAQADARTNATRRGRSLASGSLDDSTQPSTSAPQLKTTLGGGTTQS